MQGQRPRAAWNATIHHQSQFHHQIRALAFHYLGPGQWPGQRQWLGQEFEPEPGYESRPQSRQLAEIAHSYWQQLFLQKLEQELE